MMKKGFTLLELVVVIIILGVLATLGITQYGRMVEKARKAEARMIMGDIRKLALAYRLANGTVNGMTDADVNIGDNADQIPEVEHGCRSSHFYSYNVFWRGDPEVDVVALRCTSGGKEPQGTEQYQMYFLFTLDGSKTRYAECGSQSECWYPGSASVEGW